MWSVVLNKMDTFARNLLPVMTMFFILVITAVPTQLPLISTIMPSLLLIGVYYWTVYRPDLLNGLVILLLGVVHDFLIGGPIGVSSFVLLLLHLAVVTQGRFFSGRSFSLVWWGFMVIASVACLITWVTTMLLHAAWIDPTAAGIGLLLTIILYPPIAYLLSQAHKLVPARDAEA